MRTDPRRVAASDPSLLAAATATMMAVRIALWVLPFRVVRAAVMGSAVRSRFSANTPRTVDRIVAAVTAASRVVPRATCLTQSLTAQVLLGRHGHPVELRLGVAREAGRFDAHAWVECDGRVVVGDADVGRYTPVARLSDR
jgi:transglutaminase superfamily protein